MKIQKFFLLIIRFITVGIGIVFSIYHMFLFRVSKENITLLFFFIAMLFLSVALFKRDLSASKKSNVKKNIPSNMNNKSNKTSSSQVQNTYFHETVNLSESNNKELNSTKDELIQNVVSENIDIEEKPAIDDEQYRNFAKLAAQRVIKDTEIPCMVIKSG